MKFYRTKNGFIFSLLLIVSGPVLAQNKPADTQVAKETTVTGKVMDEKGQGIAGASVMQTTPIRAQRREANQACRAVHASIAHPSTPLAAIIPVK